MEMTVDTNKGPLDSVGSAHEPSTSSTCTVEFVCKRPTYPWVCPTCHLHVFLDKRKGCPVCDQQRFKIEDFDLKIEYPTPNREVPIPPRAEKKLLQVMNQGPTKQRKDVELPPKPEGATRFVCISDTHTKHRGVFLPDGDVLIHSGDISMCGRLEVLEDFNKWMGEQRHPNKIVIAGNHEVICHPEFYENNFWRYHENKYNSKSPQEIFSNCTYLEDSWTTINAINIYGSPWVTPYHNWAWNLSEEQLAEKFAMIPENIHVLVTHNPPKGHRSKTHKGDDIGSHSLLAATKRVKPLVHVFGHVHFGYGKVKSEKTCFINAAMVDLRYNTSNAPIVFDIL